MSANTKRLNKHVWSLADVSLKPRKKTYTSNGIGILSMKERARMKGTQISVKISLKNVHAVPERAHRNLPPGAAVNVDA
jgi:hypothetical protein